MLYIGKRFRIRGLQSHRGKRPHPLRRLLALAATVIAATGIFSEKGLSSVSQELTQEAARHYLLSTVNEAVNFEMEKEENSFVETVRGEDGRVALITADAEALNRLRGDLLSALSEKLNEKAVVHIPAGSLTGVALFNGRGFSIPVRLSFEGSADVAFETQFLSAGVNQTCYRLTMVVRARVISQSKRFEASEELETSTVLSETVIVGEVPRLAEGILK